MTKVKAAGLRFVGGQRFIFGVPRRDLEPADLERLVYRDPRTSRMAPGAEGFAEALDRRRASLVKSGLYADATASSSPTPPALNREQGGTEPGPGDTVSIASEAAPADPAPTESQAPTDPPPADEAARAAEEE